MSNPFDQFDPPAPAGNPFDQFDTGPGFGAKVGDAAKLGARGASSEGLYLGIEGASRLASHSPVQRGVDRVQDWLTEKVQGFPMTDEQKATRRKMRGEADEQTGSAAFDRGLRWYADAVHETRDKIRKGLPVAPESEQALWGQISQGVGQAIGTLPTYAIPGLGPASTVGQLYQQGYDDAKEHGADDTVAHDAGVKNVPASALEYLSDRLIIGKVLKPLKGKLTVGQLLKGLATTAGAEGATEGTQQAWQNYVASSLSGYDPDRPLDDGVINAVIVGATVGGLVGGGGPVLAEGARRFDERADDTSRNKPERPQDLQAQQQQLVAGDRAVQMFPLGTEELPLPKGMQRVETPRGVFHFDPRQMTADEIYSASKNGKENELLGLGPFDKAEIQKRAATGEPVAVVTERGPNGEELRGALATPSTVEATKAALEAGKSADSTVKLERLAETLARRDVDADIERSLPDGESKDYLRGRTKKDLQRQAETTVDLPALWKGTVDAVLATGASPKEFSGLERTLELLADKEGRKKAGLRAKVTPERITAMLGNTVLDGALRGSDFTRLVTALAQSPANIEALRDEFQRAREGEPATKSPVPPVPSPEVANTTPEPSTVPAALVKLLDEMERLQQPMKVYNEAAMGARQARIRELRDQLDSQFPDWRKQQLKVATEREVARARLREQIAAEAETERKNRAEIERKKATAEQALKDAAEKRKAESERLATIDRTGRDPDTGLIADLQKVPTKELENFDWDKDRYMHGGDEVKAEDIDAVLAKRFADEERTAAGANEARFTLLDLLKGKRAALEAAGLSSPLRLMSPKEAKQRGTLAGEHAALRERTGGFAYFSRDGLAEDGLQEQLAGLGFDVPDVTAAYSLIERAMNGEEIQPLYGSERGQVEFARRKIDEPAAVAEDAGREETAKATEEKTAPGDLPAKGAEDVPAGGAGRRLAEIEEKLLRGAAERDTAARAVNKFVDAQEGKPNWPKRWKLFREVATRENVHELNAERPYFKPIPQLGRTVELMRAIDQTIDDTEARALAAAVKKFDQGGRFEWPDMALRDRVLANFARRDGQRSRQIEELATHWWGNLERLAPGLAKESELRFGSSEALVEQGLARRDELTGEEEAARVRDFKAKKEIFYLFEQALRKNTGDITRLNLQHEMAHAFWDTLDRTTHFELNRLFAREIETKTGPLFDAEGNLRDNVALGATEDIQEWFAERLAHANDRWAQRRIETGARGDTLVATVAAAFRRLLLQMRELMEKHLVLAGYDDTLLSDFRRFLDQGTKWAPEPIVTGRPVPAFARRAKTEAEFDEALRNFDRLERQRDELAKRGEKVPREVLTSLSDAREVLEESWPGWRETHKERAAELAANDEPSPEPEAGVSADQDVREIAPELTKAKISQVTASSFRPVSGVKEWLGMLGRMFTHFRSSIPELPGGTAGREFTRFRQGYRMLKAATEHSRREAEDRVAHVLEPITNLGPGAIAPNQYRRLLNVAAAIKQLSEGDAAGNAPAIAKLGKERATLETELERLPYHLFRKTVLFRDLWFRSKILNENGDPITLPGYLTRDEVEGELRELHAKIAASPDSAAIEESLKRHYALVKNTRDDLLARGYIIPEELRNPLYFPHLVLEKFSGRLQSVKLDTAEDFRSYLQQLTGSAKDVETDYLTAMYYHMGQVMAHNARQDIVETYWQPYDKTKELEAELKEANAKRAEQGLGPLKLEQIKSKDDVIYTVDDRIPLRPEYVINRQVLADRLGVALGEGDLQAQLRELGLDVTITAADIQQALGAGEKKKWVLPAPVAAALEGIVDRDTKSRQLLQRALAKPQGWWKWYKLFSPTSVIRYTYGNLVADVEKLFSADPAVFRELLPAYREVREFAAGGEPSADLKEAFQRGVIQTVTAGEVGEIKQAERFDTYLTSREKLLGMLHRGVQWGAKVNELREAAFRYAKFRADLDRMRRGERPVYAGAYSKDVEAIEDSKPGANDAIFAKAAEIARKTFVDYDDISVSGDALRKYWVPFYSWMEGNFRYHANLFRNLRDMSAGAGMAQLSRGGLVAASKVVLPRSVTGVLLRLALPYVAASLWNNSDDREELEKTLSPEDQRRFHLILGKDAKGQTIVVYAPTALSDVAEWFGGNDFARLAGDYMHGRTTLPQLAHDWLRNTPKATLNKAVQGLNPFFKTVLEFAARKSFFPDATDARSIPDHDLGWHVLGSMTDLPTADAIRRVMDKEYYSSKDGWEWAQQIILQARRRDPEQWGYYATLDRVDEWLDAHGGLVERGANNKDDAQLLTSFRRAIRAADVPAAIQFYHKLLDAGYTVERFTASVRAGDPLQPIKKEQRQAFLDSLQPAAQEDLRRAYRYAQRLQTFKHHERQLFPSKKASEAYRARFAAAPRDDVFAGIMLDVATQSDDEEELKAEKLLNQALRRK